MGVGFIQEDAVNNYCTKKKEKKKTKDVEKDVVQNVSLYCSMAHPHSLNRIGSALHVLDADVENKLFTLETQRGLYGTLDGSGTLCRRQWKRPQ